MDILTISDISDFFGELGVMKTALIYHGHDGLIA